jgi:hypothetical protein
MSCPTTKASCHENRLTLSWLSTDAKSAFLRVAASDGSSSLCICICWADIPLAILSILCCALSLDLRLGLSLDLESWLGQLPVRLVERLGRRLRDVWRLLERRDLCCGFGVTAVGADSVASSKASSSYSTWDRGVLHAYKDV